jgi:hypothetical protein
VQIQRVQVLPRGHVGCQYHRFRTVRTNARGNRPRLQSRLLRWSDVGRSTRVSFVLNQTPVHYVQPSGNNTMAGPLREGSASFPQLGRRSPPIRKRTSKSSTILVGLDLALRLHVAPVFTVRALPNQRTLPQIVRCLEFTRKRTKFSAQNRR